MNNDWMAASSFGRAFEVISAINILSIHAKLLLGGNQDPQSEKTIKKARNTLLNFINNLDHLLSSADSQQDGMIIGSDPRMSELAQIFISGKQSYPIDSDLFRSPLDLFQGLVLSDDPGDMPRLIAFLQELRALIEQHSHTDIIEVLGDL